MSKLSTAEEVNTSILHVLKTTPPPKTYGKEARSLFMLDEEYTNLNHGSFGSVPLAVHEAGEILSRYIERNPDRYIRQEYNAQIDTARAVVADHIGVERDTCVFVPGVSAGIATVLRNFKWTSQDIIVSTDTIYDTILSIVEEICAGENRPQHSTFALNLPLSHSSILDQFRLHLRLLNAQVHAAAGTSAADRGATTAPAGKIVVIIESITSSPGILMPWKEMVKICRAEEAWSVVDAAHSLGQELDTDLKALDPDFWVSNGAKWGYAKRGCAILYVPFRNQDMITSGVLPGLKYASSGLSPTRFVQEFYWTGLIDPAPPISIVFAIKFRQQIGGEVMIQKYCHELALQGGRRMAEIMNTTVLDCRENPGELIANMVNVELPLSSTTRKSFKEIYFLFSEQLLETYKIYATYFLWKDKWWTRVSAQIYNEIGDFEKLANAFLEICGKITESD
ncbi:MAG: pyridoxal phosphate-dependent transferase [Lentinula lateritia]|uniref:PLP-dependent transferase n=1 Tax=Lentinula lateritia TaxID=40482 RepID=A0ABQ8VV12_9AGAR|nr:MAG: pyridoxal phosphate-dependent transferase [Lentinula lateritia]KAJ4500191.1 PLP-dependent transferase [Lentinula lateritia]